MRRLPERCLYLVTDRPACLGRDLVGVVLGAVRGGVSIVQLREKACDTREFVELARALKGALDPLGVGLVINDRVDVALAVGAAGIHVGQSDMDPKDVRRLVGQDMLVGLSVTGWDEVLSALDEPVDYLGVGPIFATPTKPDAGDPLGVEGLAQVRARCGLPLVAIGGVGAANLAQVWATGVDSVAVVSAVCSATSPEQAARDLSRLMPPR